MEIQNHGVAIVHRRFMKACAAKHAFDQQGQLVQQRQRYYRTISMALTFLTSAFGHIMLHMHKLPLKDPCAACAAHVPES
eukprot:1138819-Pelagomonas_calceolata.AAC.2